MAGSARVVLPQAVHRRVGRGLRERVRGREREEEQHALEPFEEALEQLERVCSAKDFVISLHTMRVMAQRIVENPDEAKFRSIRHSNKQFNERVGKHGEAAERCLLVAPA